MIARCQLKLFDIDIELVKPVEQNQGRGAGVAKLAGELGQGSEVGTDLGGDRRGNSD